MIYRSKIDAWLAAVVVGTMLPMCGLGLWLMFLGGGRSIGERIVPAILLVALSLFFLWMFFSTRYLLAERELIIHYGPFKKIVPLASIKAVRKTSSLLSSPALSLKRLEISYGVGEMVLISPKDRDEFMEILQQKSQRNLIE
ncbi:PH domain-containing protein [Brevibacillus ruminantium]|uniref:PH domain-containing protein n=1 Tax=Brevibacillus ruminantium TaxID=2950604 RepID=A0ABY4WCJ5_9BACL|nr:PH domain-containing protein [Brevibacillus ruminantium]USG64911.1 PH domain-containing protein [Brevibacillus ruminantium]